MTIILDVDKYNDRPYARRIETLKQDEGAGEPDIMTNGRVGRF